MGKDAVMKPETIQLIVIAFGMLTLAEFWGKVAESRKMGYLAALIFMACIAAVLVVANIGYIIYGIS